MLQCHAHLHSTENENADQLAQKCVMQHKSWLDLDQIRHDVGLTHFRLKMDAVPGIPTTMWFTPLYTTKEMREKTGNPNFSYEISCDQMCGTGHYSMKGIIEVVDQEEYDMWMAKQKPK